MSAGTRVCQTLQTEMEIHVAEGEEEKVKRSYSRLPQYLAAVAATLMSFCGGTCLAWTSSAEPLLKAEGLLSATQASWLGSLLSLGAVLGAPVAGHLLPRRGRRGTLLLLGLPFVVSYAVMLALRTSPACMFAARLLAGVSLGGLCVAAPVYVAEIAEDSIRGQLGSFLQVMFSGGILFAYALGLSANYVLLCVCCLLAPLLTTVVLYCLPETPHHHLASGRKQEATSALQWLRGGRQDVSEELRAMQAHLDQASLFKVSWRHLLSISGARKALFVSMGLLAFQQLSGVCAVLFFAQNIFQEAGAGVMSPATSSVVMGAFMLAASCLGPLIVDRAGRRTILASSSVVLTLSLAVLGAYFLAKELSIVPATLTWVPLVSAVVYIVAYCVGLGPLPWTVMAELLPPDVKHLGGSLSSSFCWFTSFAVSKSFQDLQQHVGMYFAFWCFSFCCLVAVIFVFFFVPETKGKSLCQIQEELTKGKWRIIPSSEVV